MAVPKSLKRAIYKIGSEITIYQGKTRNELPVKEKIITTLSNQATKPFIREYYLQASFAYDTLATVGDLIHITLEDRTYLIMNLTGDPLKNVVNINEAILYKTNNTVTVQRLIPVFNPDKYEDEDTWVAIDTDHEDIPCLLSGTRFGNELSDYEGIGSLPLNSLVCYLSGYYDVKQNDRLVFGTGETLKVEAAVKYNYPNAYEITLSEDNN